VAEAQWVDLSGADNVRDLAGLPTVDGRVVQPGRLLRGDSLQTLTDADVRLLVDAVGLRAVADLRAGVEVSGEGPGPLTREPSVTVQHFSLFPEVGTATDAAALDDEPVLLPWQVRDAEEAGSEAVRRHGAAATYLRYLEDRPDSVIGALRLIAHTDGATLVHCAVGKDRTGTVIAVALAEVGVPAEEIAADYARSAERVPAVFERLVARPTYTDDVTPRMEPDEIDRHLPRAETIARALEVIDTDHGGVPKWLRANGWTDTDAEALRRHLLD
jgi:protein tyrosine/serine phosphatase